MHWYNEPSQWQAQNNTVKVQVDPDTDFWRLTHSGAIRNNGQFYYQSHEGDFLAWVKFSGQYASLYDQAGLMVRVDDEHWLKCGIEFIDGIQHASAVVTREYSDWSVVALPDNPASFWLRVKRENITLEVSYSLDGKRYQLLRQAYLSPEPVMQVGLMGAAPVGPGFSVTFEDFTLQSL